jgi:hypothetical protein
MGLVYATTGVAMLVAPRWFFDTIGTFPPFNRHYLGDLGAFTLPIGVALLWAVRDDRYRPGAVLVALLASAIHLLNHVFDAVVGSVPERGWSDVPLLAIILVVLAAVVYWPKLVRIRSRPALAAARVVSSLARPRAVFKRRTDPPCPSVPTSPSASRGSGSTVS